MKRWNMFYDNCRLPIRIMYVAFVLLAIGYYIQSDNVNIFYTITNSYIILIGQVMYRIGHFLVINMPLIFLVNLVAKKANSGMPALLALIGYVTFLVTTMVFNNHELVNQAYTNVLGISLSTSGDTYYPFQMGMIGSVLVALSTRYSYLKSRNNSIYSFFSFMNKDTRAIIYNVILCGLLGFASVLLWPYCVEMLQDVLAWIAEDISDPIRLCAYGLTDRVSSILGLSTMVRYPFWFTATGGTYANISGTAVLGDVNIWSYMPEALTTYSGAGRFITPYYIINMFACPALYLGMFFTISDKKDRRRHLVFLVFSILLSIICGNPLPMELLLLVTSPLLLLAHLGLSASLFGLLFVNVAFMGFSYSGSVVSAMPGAFCDFIINARTPAYTHSMSVIMIVGIIYAVIYFLITIIYYRFLAFDIVGSNKTKMILARMYDGVGGLENIESASSELFNMSIELYDLDKINYDVIKRVGAKSIIETKTGLIFDFGSASTVIKRAISKQMKNRSRA